MRPRRIEVSAGGGTAYLHYSETVPSNASYYPVNCYSYTTRRGWGGYGLANISYFLDSDRNFRVGTMFQYIAGSTNGQAVASLPATRTTDHWPILGFGLGFSF